MDIKAAEISAILKDQIKNFGQEAQVSEVGQVLSVGDGIARVYGLDNVQAGELVELPGGIKGMALNLETDNVGVVIFGSDLAFGAVMVFALKRLFAQRRLALLTALGLMVAVALTLSVPLYADAVYGRTLSQTLLERIQPGDSRPPFAYMFRQISLADQPMKWDKVLDWSFDPKPYVKWFEGGNGWKNDELVAAFNEALNNLDSDIRHAAIRKVQELVLDEVPHVYLVQPYWYHVVQNYVKDMYASFTNFFPGLREVWLDK